MRSDAVNNDMERFFNKRTINKESPIPLYYQLKEIILEFVKRSNPGDALPTEEKLCKIYDISRPTARQAIREVALSCNLKRVKGKGTFIGEEIKLHQFITNFNDIMKRLGPNTTAKVLELKDTDIDDRGCIFLELPIGSKIYTLRRIIYSDDTPVALTFSYFPYKMFPDFEKNNFESQSILDIIQSKYKYDVTVVKKSLEAKMIGEFEAEIFEIGKSQPVLYVETSSYDSKGNILEFSMERYRADRNRFEFKLNGM